MCVFLKQQKFVQKEHVCRPEMFWRTSHIQLPPKDLCKGLAKQTEMKSAFQANFGLQAQLLLLLSSHKAWLQCQLGWGQSPTRRPSIPQVPKWRYFFQEWLSFPSWGKNGGHRQLCVHTLGPAGFPAASHLGPQQCSLCSSTRKHYCTWDPKHFIKCFQPLHAYQHFVKHMGMETHNCQILRAVRLISGSRFVLRKCLLL